MEIVYTPKFARRYKKLPIEVKNTAEKNEIIFRDNPLDPRLKTHKLKGRLKGFLSFSVDQKYRIIFEFSKNQEMVYFHSIGTHNIYR